MTNDRRLAASAAVSHGRCHLTVTVSAGAVTDVGFLPLGAAPEPMAGGPPAGPDEALLRRAQEQLKEYLQGQRQAFDLPLRQPGTLFQDGVWQALRQVPWGHTSTYAQLAERIGKPDAARAVGMALNKNRLPILIPCHRILAADGLGGFSAGREWKMALLAIEGTTLGLI